MTYLDHDRLESLEREMVSLKGQVTHSFVPGSNENDLNRTLTSKKPPVSQPISARVMSPSRLPLSVNTRKLSNDDTSVIHTNDGPFSRSLPQGPVTRSKSFHNGTSHPPSSPPSNSSDEVHFLRSYKVHLEQVLRKDAPPFSDIKVPTYQSVEDIIRSNEVLIRFHY
jgi:hypothetical protein